MALNVANWSDKQLDELADLIKTADHSDVAAFVVKNFLAMEPNPSLYANGAPTYVPLNTSTGRIIADNSANDSQPLRVKATTPASSMVTINPGVYVYGGKVGQIDAAATVNILDPAGAGQYGRGQIADAQPRYSIVEIRVSDYPHTPQLRWFVDDTTDPNTYGQRSTNTLINKAYPDIIVKHGTAGVTPSVPTTDAGYWCIAEIYITGSATTVTGANIRDTVTTASARNPANWTDPSSPPVQQTRVSRFEFWSSLFGVDHHTSGSYAGRHRKGVWAIDGTAVRLDAVQMNWLDPTATTPHSGYSKITYANFQKLFDGSNCDTLHTHTASGGGTTYPFTIDHDGTSGYHKDPIHLGTSETMSVTEWKALTDGPSSNADSYHTHPSLNFSAGGASASGTTEYSVVKHATNFTDVTDMTVTITTPTGGGNYVILFTFNTWTDSNANHLEIQFVNGSGVVLDTGWRQTENNSGGSILSHAENFQARTIHTLVTFSPGSNTVKVQAKCEVDYVKISKRRLTVYRIS